MCRRSGRAADMARSRCPGSAVDRWHAKIGALAEVGITSSFGHCRMLTGDVLWCNLCGAYALDKAVGMAQPCPGPPTLQLSLRGGGRGQQLNRLRRGCHPKSGVYLDEPIPEPWWGAVGAPRPVSHDLNASREDLSGPSSSSSRLSRLRERVRMREAALHGVSSNV